MFQSGTSLHRCGTWPHFYYCIIIWHQLGAPIIRWLGFTLMWRSCVPSGALWPSHVKLSIWNVLCAPAEATTQCTLTPLPPVMATFIEPRLICQSTFLLLRDRLTGRLSDCPSAVITFSTTCCSAAPQTPGKLPRPLTFPLEKIHMETAVTGWHSTFYIWGGRSGRNPLRHPLLHSRFSRGCRFVLTERWVTARCTRS